MKTIWKYELPVRDVVYINMPVLSQILTIQEQRGSICLWALVDPNASQTQRVFRIVGTGHDVPEHNTGVYIDTFQMEGGDLVFHVFEINLHP